MPPRKKTTKGPVPVEATVHADKRANLPTADAQEFVTPEVGVLVDPADPEALVRALSDAASLGTPHPPARAAAAEHDVRRQAARMAGVLEAAAGR